MRGFEISKKISQRWHDLEQGSQKKKRPRLWWQGWLRKCCLGKRENEFGCSALKGEFRRVECPCEKKEAQRTIYTADKKGFLR